MRDLLGDEMPEPTPLKGRRQSQKPAGYFAPPGKGPAGETCRTCEFSALKGNVAGRYYKCWKNTSRHTGGRKTDILLKSPACIGWEKRRTE